MKIEAVSIRNYRVFQDAQAKDLPGLMVILGKNGSGKTTFFDVFGFLHDCLLDNVSRALAKRGGYQEVVSREHCGEDISIEIKFRISTNEPLMTYRLSVGTDKTGKAVVNREILQMRRGKSGSPWKILDFSCGQGEAVEGELKSYDDLRQATRRNQKLESPDILAIKGLGQFKDFPSVVAFRKLVEDWYVSDFRTDAARERYDSDHSEHLTRTGNNLACATKFIRDNCPELFDKIIKKMRQHIPGIGTVEAAETQDGYIVLRFQDGGFRNPFSAKYVSDGTIRLFMYLVLLYDPQRHALLCVEEPENQLYPELLPELAEEFLNYSIDEQVFVSTHSPEFLNAVPLDSIYCLEKINGYTVIKRARDNSTVKSLIEDGDLPGYLWRQRILAGV